ncbi:GNAT family N-acetyltransferase [Stappia sp.]|uniref:GNAT family N-acetyltransferase n=1 Tax=Stappia sp. TaxID=1870903 RepID=UPI003D11C279
MNRIDGDPAADPAAGAGLDLARIRAIEDANLNGFPSDRLVMDGSWLARISPGNPARRVNSLNVMDPLDDADARARLDAMLAVFAENDVVFHLRRTPLTPPALVAIADAGGWGRTGETDVWVRPIGAAADAQEPDQAAGAARLRPCTLEQFLSAFAAIGGTRPEAVTPLAVARLGSALERIAVRRVTLVAEDDGGRPLGVVLGVADREMFGIYDLAVAPMARRAGLGARLVRAAMARGAASGCRHAWLQVTAENAPARALYRRLGFRDGYAYHYRLPPERPHGS